MLANWDDSKGTETRKNWYPVLRTQRMKYCKTYAARENIQFDYCWVMKGLTCWKQSYKAISALEIESIQGKLSAYFWSNDRPTFNKYEIHKTVFSCHTFDTTTSRAVQAELSELSAILPCSLSPKDIHLFSPFTVVGTTQMLAFKKVIIKILFGRHIVRLTLENKLN